MTAVTLTANTWSNFIWPSDWPSVTASWLCVEYPIYVVSDGQTGGKTYVSGDSAEYDFTLAPGTEYWLYPLESFVLDLTAPSEEWGPEVVYVLLAGVLATCVVLVLVVGRGR